MEACSVPTMEPFIFFIIQAVAHIGALRAYTCEEAFCLHTVVIFFCTILRQVRWFMQIMIMRKFPNVRN